jgi:hypothetical protein
MGADYAKAVSISDMRSLGILLLLLAIPVSAQSTFDAAVAYMGEQTLTVTREDGVIRANDRMITAGGAVRVAMDALETNSALIVFTQADGAVIGWRVDPSGRNVGGGVLIGGNASGPVAIAAGRDRYVVAWPSPTGDIYATILSASGAPLVPPLVVTTQGPRIREINATAMGNAFALVWHVWPEETKVFATILDEAGVPLSMNPILVTDRGAFPDVTSNGSNFYAVWDDEGVIRARNLDRDGSLGRVQLLRGGDVHAPRVAWDGYAYTVAFAQIGRPRPGTAVAILAVNRFTTTGAFVEALSIPGVVYFPRAWDVDAREGRVAVVPSLTFEVGPPPLRRRIVRG